jgi:hypothetical protein
MKLFAHIQPVELFGRRGGPVHPISSDALSWKDGPTTVFCAPQFGHG